MHHALYDWDFQRQLLSLRGESGEDELYSRRFLLRRPLLEALEADEPVVLLIDEIDRADDEFEAFLLELLSDFQVSIPELGTIVATRRPMVVLTSNRTRELHDALKRRCLYHWIDYPTVERELEIVRVRLPGVPEEIAARSREAVADCGRRTSTSSPGVGETITWARALRGARRRGIAEGDARRRAQGPRGRGACACGRYLRSRSGCGEMRRRGSGSGEVLAGPPGTRGLRARDHLLRAARRAVLDPSRSGALRCRVCRPLSLRKACSTI